MNTPLSRTAAQDRIRAVLAADCACPETALDADGLLITAAEDRPGRRRYPRPDPPLLIVSIGHGVVVTCHPGQQEAVRRILGDRPRDAIFAAETIADLARMVAGHGQVLYGPVMKYACAPATFRPVTSDAGTAISVVEADSVQELYQWPGFENALSYRPDHPRPDVAAAVARHQGSVVGIAGASDDCDALWQIGVDVVPDARGAGIGRALVSRLTELAFQRGRIPYYSTAVSNLRSQALALSPGYWPSWVELASRAASAPRPQPLTNSTEAR